MKKILVLTAVTSLLFFSACTEKKESVPADAETAISQAEKEATVSEGEMKKMAKGAEAEAKKAEAEVKKVAKEVEAEAMKATEEAEKEAKKIGEGLGH